MIALVVIVFCRVLDNSIMYAKSETNKTCR